MLITPYLSFMTVFRRTLALRQRHGMYLLLLTICLLSVRCGVDPGQTARQQTFLHQGVERSFLYYAPKDLPPNAPLVLVFHGFTSNAQTIMDYSGYNQLADQHGFAVAYPQGSIDAQGNTFWNVGYDFHADSGVDDLDYVAQLLPFLQETYQLSTRNTFAVGMSNGGELCYLLACQEASRFRAIATVAATMMSQELDRCQPATEIPLLSIFGTADQTTRYQGDAANQDGWGAYAGIPSVIDFWAGRIQADTLIRDTLPDLVVEDGSWVQHEQYRHTLTGPGFDFYKIVGGGHDWPGAWGNQDINASDLTWAFFAAHLD